MRTIKLCSKQTILLLFSASKPSFVALFFKIRSFKHAVSFLCFRDLLHVSFLTANRTQKSDTKQRAVAETDSLPTPAGSAAASGKKEATEGDGSVTKTAY